MTFWKLALVCVLTSGCASAGRGLQPPDPTGDGGSVDLKGSACPGFDTQNDAKHCGSCSNACGPGLICALGVCTFSCASPLVACPPNGCIDTTSDPDHCNGCGLACHVVPDMGPAGGNGNPDAGLPPTDAGVSPGWYRGTEYCSSSHCGVTCPPSTTLCTDNLCWDTKNAHAHCGTCNIACNGNQHCNAGKCCGIGQANCGNLCIDVLSDAANCGACNNACPPSATCVNGACKGPPPVTFTGNFQGAAGAGQTALCSQWTTFLGQLGTGYSTVTLSGSLDSPGVTCNTPSVVNALAAALKGMSSYISPSCNGHVWSTCNRYNDEVWIDPPSLCDSSNCPSPGRILRACFGNPGYNGLNTVTCSAAPTQTITLTFQ